MERHFLNEVRKKNEIGRKAPYTFGKAIAIHHHRQNENKAFNKTLICD